MKAFSSPVVLPRPLDEIWTTLRDGLPALAPRLPGVISIREIAREDLGAGKLRVANEWHVNYAMPSAIRSMMGVADIGWIDRSTWDIGSHVCTWKIQPLISEHVACEGQTSFEPAAGGKSTRIGLDGTLEIKPGVFGGKNSGAQSIGVKFLEGIVAAKIRKNLRAVLEAAGTRRG
jgi:hypothetical protein